jgi:hypothetical protein
MDERRSGEKKKTNTKLGRRPHMLYTSRKYRAPLQLRNPTEAVE